MAAGIWIRGFASIFVTMIAMLRSSASIFACAGAVLLMSFTKVHAGPSEIVLNDDGGWCWFEDERAIVVEDTLMVGTVANGAHDASRKGDTDVVTYDLKRGRVQRSTLHKNLQADDHDSPALLRRPSMRPKAVTQVSISPPA